MNASAARPRERAEQALAALGQILAGFGLSLAADKTCIVRAPPAQGREVAM
jgi:hypothetical protein